MDSGPTCLSIAQQWYCRHQGWCLVYCAGLSYILKLSPVLISSTSKTSRPRWLSNTAAVTLKVISSGITASSTGSHQNSPHPYCHFVLPLSLYSASRRGRGRQESLGRWEDDQATLKMACCLHLFRLLHRAFPYLKLQYDTVIFRLVSETIVYPERSIASARSVSQPEGHDPFKVHISDILQIRC